MNRTSVSAFAVAMTMSASGVLAHPGHADSGFAAGATHPVAGLDHVLAMVAVGLLAAKLGGRALWVLPAAFIALMVAGGAVAFAGVALPGVEHGIAASVVVLGIVLAVATRAPVGPVAMVAALFALFHGYAHVAEAGAGSVAPYAAGFVLTTALLHAGGIGVALLAARLADSSTPPARFTRLAGSAIAACGALLYIGAL